MPVRIQRSRKKGWRMPPGAICVSRGTRWGNPYKIDSHLTREHSIQLFKHHLKLMKERYSREFEDYISPLRGKDLACWCGPDESCHADILLEEAAYE